MEPKKNCNGIQGPIQCLVCQGSFPRPPNNESAEAYVKNKTFFEDFAKLFFDKNILNELDKCGWERDEVTLCSGCQPELNSLLKTALEMVNVHRKLIKELQLLQKTTKLVDLRLKYIYELAQEVEETIPAGERDAHAIFEKGILKASEKLKGLQDTFNNGKDYIKGLQFNSLFQNDESPASKVENGAMIKNVSENKNDEEMRQIVADPVLAQEESHAEDEITIGEVFKVKTEETALEVDILDSQGESSGQEPVLESIVKVEEHFARKICQGEVLSKDMCSSVDSVPRVACKDPVEPELIMLEMEATEKVNEKLAELKDNVKDNTEGNVSARNSTSRSAFLHSCPSCVRSFFRYPDLMRHLRSVHAGSLRFRCEKCPNVYFTRKDNLLRHKKQRHMKVANPKCPKDQLCPKCPGKRYFKYLKEHLVTFHGTKYPCPFCHTKSFSTYQTMKQHFVHCRVGKGRSKSWNEITQKP